MKEGQRITVGTGEDQDTGIIDAIKDGQATVRWDSGVVTTQPIEALKETK